MQDSVSAQSAGIRGDLQVVSRQSEISNEHANLQRRENGDLEDGN